MNKRILQTAGILFVLATPAFVLAQATTTSQFSRDGILSCQGGQYAQSVGAQSATAGTYVPVADATVELNTGILIYKECTLREIVDRMREAATAALVNIATNAMQTGRNGNAQYVVNEGSELYTVNYNSTLTQLQGTVLDPVNAAYKNQVKTAVARAFEANTHAANQRLACPYTGDLNAQIKNQSFSWDGFLAEGNSACNPLYTGEMAYDQVLSTASRATQYQQDQWNWGNGFYAKTDNAQDPLAQQTLTPSIVVQESYQKLLDTSVTQLENANDVGQMIGALFAGLSTQAISSATGLAGLTQSVGGQPSYLSQVVSQSQQGLVNSVVNLAFNNLNVALQVETAYNQVINSIASLLTQTIQQLRSAESQCWAQIIQRVCTSAPTPNGTCTDAAGATLHIATSTAFSQPVIDSQVAPLGQSALTGLQRSNSALNQINQLIAGVSNTASLDAQRVALLQLDQLTASGAIHTTSDLSNLQQQQTSIQTSMTGLAQTVVQNWTGTDSNGQSTIVWDGTANPGNGWCNYNNAPTIAAWDARWKQ